MKKIFIALFLLCSFQAGAAEYYVSTTGGATKTGSKADPFDVASIPWSSLEAADHTIYFCGGTYTSQMSIRHNTESYRLTLRPGSAAPDPSGIDAQVIWNYTAGNGIVFNSGATAAHNVTLSGETTVGAGTRNWKVICPTADTAGKHGIGSGGSAEIRGNKILYLELTGLYDLDYPWIAITNCTNNGSGAIRVTANGHPWVNNDEIVIVKVTGTVEANNSTSAVPKWVVTKIDENNFDLNDSTFANAYITGGHCYREGATSYINSNYVLNAIYWGAGSEIAYNYFHDNWGHTDIRALVLAASTGYGVISIHHNTVEKGTMNYISGARGLDIYNNTFDVSAAVVPYDVLHAYATDGIDYIRIFNNHFDSNEQMIFLENASTNQCSSAPCLTQKIRIYNNTITCTSPETHRSVFKGGRPLLIENADAGGGGVDDMIVANNTFVNTEYGMRAAGPGTGSTTYTNFKFVNNIFSDSSANAGYENNALFLISSNITWANEADAVFDYNLMYDNDDIRFSWLDEPGGTTTVYTSLSTFVTAHPTYSHNPTPADPLFTGAADFTLQSGSPAINTGFDASAYTNMGSGWGYDKNGVDRGSAWDIGAYEWQDMVQRHGRGIKFSGAGGFK